MEGELFYKYTIGAEPLLIPLKFYEIGICTEVPLIYKVEIIPETPSDSVITYDGKKIRIYTSQQQDAGGYQIRITANTPNRVNKTTEFFVRISEMKISQVVSTAHSSPFFASDLERMINVTYKFTKIYKLPKIKDPNPSGQVTMSFVSSMNSSGLPAFIELKANKLIIKPTQTIEVSIHEITIILSNLNRQTKNYTMLVQVIPYDPYALREQSITIDTSQRKYFMVQSKKENFPKARILKVNQMGEVIVKLDRRGSNVELKIDEDNFQFKIDPPQGLKWQIKEDR